MIFYDGLNRLNTSKLMGNYNNILLSFKNSKDKLQPEMNLWLTMKEQMMRWSLLKRQKKKILQDTKGFFSTLIQKKSNIYFLSQAVARFDAQKAKYTQENAAIIQKIRELSNSRRQHIDEVVNTVFF